MPAPPPAWETEELKAALDAEVVGLPERYRSVVVLCLVETRTRADAAAVLGVPVGTIDSRLNAARKRLQARLARRGLAIGLGASLEPMLGEPATATGGRVLERITGAVSAALADATGPGTGAVSPAVVELSQGVTMTTTKLRLLAGLGVVLGLIGGTGAGIYFATAADPVPPVARAAAPATVAEPSPASAPDRPDARVAPRPDGEAALLKPLGKKITAPVKLDELFSLIEDQTQLVVRVDVAAFRRLRVGVAGEDDETKMVLKAIYATSVVLPRRVERLPTRDVLADALAQIGLSVPCTYQVRGSQLIIVPAFVPPAQPGVDPLAPRIIGYDDGLVVSLPVASEQIHGGVVRVTADRQPLPEILADLRAQTGANLVLDPRCEAVEKKVLTVTLSDVRLYDALRVIADMVDLKMVYAGNIYYITTVANAMTFQPPAPRPPAIGEGK